MSNQSESEVWYTIEPDARIERGVWVVKHDEWPENSVLAGYPRRSLLQWFEDIDLAVAAYPQATVLEYSTKGEYSGVELPHTPPAWFDPLDAGEQWDDDY